MAKITRWSMRFRLLVLALAAGVLALGVTQLRDAPVDVLPEFTPPYAEIQTEALGLSATEVENLITVPLEADLLNGVEGVDVIRSESLPGLSSIVLVFEPGTDVYRARQLVQERLAHAHALPRVSKPPALLPPLSSSSRVMMIGLSSETVSAIETSVIARWTITPRLMGVPGVANVAVWGMRDQQVQVLVDPSTLRDRNVTLEQVIRTAGNAQIVSPLSFLEASTPGSGGFIETPQQRLQVRNILDRLADPDELAKVPVEDAGSRLRLRDVANVTIGHQPLIGDAVVRDGDGLLLVVEKFPGADTLAVTRGVEEALETLQPGLEGIQTDTSLFRPATYIEDAIDNLTIAILIGAALLALALAALLFRWRAVAVALVTIPLALVAAALVLDAFGETFNAMSFAGLAVALALVIDDAVVGLESVGRRLRDHDGPASPVVLQATQEVRRPLSYAALIALIAIVPIVIMEGRPGAFFEPLAFAYALAVVAATITASTVAPVVSLLLFSRGGGARTGADAPLVERLRPLYARVLAPFVRAPRLALGGAAACLALGLATLPFLGTSLAPSFKDRDVLISMEAEPGTSNPRMTEIATTVSRRLRALPGVDNVGAHVGRAVGGDQTVDVSSADVWVGIEADADYEATMQGIEAVVDRTADVDHALASYSTQRIREVGALNSGANDAAGGDLDLLTGADEPLIARVYGHDLGELERRAGEVRRIMSGVDGVVDPRIERPQAHPNVVIEVDLERAQRHGIRPGDVRRSEAALVQGIHVGSVFDDQKVFDVIVQGVPETRQSVTSIRNLLIDRPGGGHVRLGQVADVRVAPAPVAIRRHAVSRYLDVEANVSGRDVSAVASDVRARLAALPLPLEYHVEVLESTTAEEIGSTTMLIFAAVAAIAAFLLLQAAFQSWRLAAIAFLLVPVAMSGGLVAILIGDGELTIGAAIGFLALLGLAARLSLVSICRFQDLESAERVAFGRELVLRGAQERMSPIVTSAACVALMVLPLVVLGASAGLEIVHPMAVVIVGGLVTSTFVGLFVLPSLYLRWAVATPVHGVESVSVSFTDPWPADATGTPSLPVPPVGNGAPPLEER